MLNIMLLTTCPYMPFGLLGKFQQETENLTSLTWNRILQCHLYGQDFLIYPFQVIVTKLFEWVPLSIIINDSKSLIFPQLQKGALVLRNSALATSESSNSILMQTPSLILGSIIRAIQEHRLGLPPAEGDCKLYRQTLWHFWKMEGRFIFSVVLYAR